MYKLVLTIIFILLGCTKSPREIHNAKISNSEVFFDTVEKSITYNTDIPNNFKNYLDSWFESKIKVNGFQGRVLISIDDYNQTEELIDDGKKITLKLNIKILIDKKSLDSTKTIFISVEEFGSITGNFSLKDYEKIIGNTQINLINRINESINSKI